MTEFISPKELIHLLQDLRRSPDSRRQSISGIGLASGLALLRDWQAQRLARTYADLLADKRYAPACRFFLSDIYSARDFSQRDYDAERLHALLARFLPPATLRLLAEAVRMNQLTNRLDQALLNALVDELGLEGEITEAIYAQGYRICDNYAERKLQIELLARILRQTGELARIPWVGAGLRLVKAPAQRAGWSELYDFLARGYAALRHMRRVDGFVEAVEARETRILERIFAGHPQPFEI